ncbi:MAG: membrane protein insertion efficiency factor YidD [Chlamydiae bacterium]|nr:membrane protein insertion efficiency factor YidD [Chlamydiota bacterium]
MHFRFCLFILFFISCTCLCRAKPGYTQPWGKDHDLQFIADPNPKADPKYSLPVTIADKIIKFHQTIISPVDGPRSHFRPTSSRYMQLAMHRHGFIKGFIMGCDRLLRENKDPWVYRTIEIDGQVYKYDPVRK